MSETDSRYPWMMFFPMDHRADSGVRLCSLGARGLWADILCLMYEAEPHGYLCIGGTPITIPQLARLVGSTLDEVSQYLDELRQYGVFSEDETGIYSRRMLRDDKKREDDRVNGRKGGNPQLKRRVIRGVNPPVNAKDKAQSPETRDQRPRSKIPKAMVKPAPASASASDQSSSVSSLPRDSDDFREATQLAGDVIALLGTSLSAPEREITVVTLHRWITYGWHPDIIKATIAGVQARESSAGQIRSLRYYEPAIADAHVPIGGQ